MYFYVHTHTCMYIYVYTYTGTNIFLISKNEISHKIEIKQFCLFCRKERLVVTQIPLLTLDLKLLNHSLHKILYL